MQVKYKSFLSRTTWEKAMDKAVQFANTIGPQRLININMTLNQSTDFADGRVTVWYWE